MVFLPTLNNQKEKKQSAIELGHSDRLPVYESNFAKTPTSQEILNRF